MCWLDWIFIAVKGIASGRFLERPSPVISSEARSAKSRNLHKKYASNEVHVLLKRIRARQGHPCPTQIHHHVVVTVALVSSPPARGRGPYNRTPNCAKAQHEVL